MSESDDILRLSPHLLQEAQRVADAEGIALSQFINASVAEKLSALRTAEYFRERAARADIPVALEILSRAGHGNPPMLGDEREA